jgi:hypothetical protein
MNDGLGHSFARRLGRELTVRVSRISAWLLRERHECGP